MRNLVRETPPMVGSKVACIMAARSKSGRRRGGDDSKAKSSEDEQEKLTINKWDSAAVKNALDDTAKKILIDDGCVEDFTLVDRRLVLCTVACGFSGFALVYDYLFPFPRSEVILAVCAISYFILMGVLSLYSIFCESAIFMLAKKTDETGKEPEEVWTLSSSLPRFSHQYSITVTFSKGGNKAKSSCTLDRSVTEWFDEEGTLVNNKFESDFKKLCEDTRSSDKTQ